MKYIIYAIFLMGISPQLLAQSWAELMAKSEKYYQTGEYNKALASKNAYIKTLNKKFKNQDNTLLLAWFTIFEAKCQEALGNYEGMNKQLQEAKTVLEKAKNQDFSNYVVASYQIIEVWIEYGYWLQANNLLDDLNKEIEANKLDNPLLRAEINQRMAYVQAAMGLGIEAEKLTQNLEKTWQEIIANKQIEGRKATKNELNYYKTRLADFYTLKGFILTQKGDYKQANIWLKDTERKVSSLVGSKSMLYIKHLLARGINSIQGDANDIDEELSTAQAKASKALKKTSKVYLACLYNLIRLYTNTEQPEKANKLLNKWTTAMSNFPEGSIYDFYYTTMDYENQLLAGEKEKLKELDKLLTNTANLPLTHPLRLVILDILYRFNTQEDYNLITAEVYLKEKLNIEKNILGEKSIPFQVSKVFLAEHQIENAENISEAKKIYAEEPQKNIFAQLNPQHRDFLEVLNCVSNYSEIIDDYAQAAQLSKQSLAIKKEKYGENALQVSDQMLKVANLLLKKGQYREAEENINQAMKIIRKQTSRKSTEYARAMSTAARLYGVIGLYDDAEDLLEKVNTIFEKSNDITLRMKTIEELAFLYLRIGKYNETEDLLTADITEKEKKYGKLSRKLITPLNQMSSLQLIKGDYKIAEKMALRATDIAEKIFGKSSTAYAESLLNLSKFYAEIGDFKRAETGMHEVVELKRKLLGNKHVELATALTELGLIKFYKEKPEKELTEQLFEESKSIILLNFDKKHPLYAEAIKDLGLLAIEKNKIEEALSYLNEADKIWSDKLGDRNKGSAEVALLLGDLYLKKGDLSTSERKYLQAEKMFGKIFSPEHPKFTKTQSKLAQVNFIKNDLTDANKRMDFTINAYLKYIKTYFPTLSENEKAKFWALMKPDFEFFNSLAIKQATRRPEMLARMYDNILATKALLLNSSIKIRQKIMNSKDLNVKELYKKWVDKKEYLITIMALLPEELAEQNINKEEIEKEVEQIEKELSEKSDAFAQGLDNTVTYTWSDLRKGLAKNEAAVEIVRFRLFEKGFSDSVLYAALIVSQETKKAPQLVLLPNGKELEKKYYSYYKNCVRYLKDDKYSYQNYWKPIVDELGEKINTIYFSPDGVYNQINMESIRIDEQNYVIDKYNMCLVSNTKDLIIKYNEKELADNNKKSRRKKDKDKSANTTISKAVLVGSPTFYLHSKGNTLGYLPGTAVEVKEIDAMLQSKNWQSEVFTKEDADELTIKNINSPKIFHIATHGLFLEENSQESTLQNSVALNNPMLRTGLALKGGGDVLEKSSTNLNVEDGILTALEASNLNLEGTDLVILSACETGRGDVQIGEGVFGLQRAFLVAGAKNVVMSIFKVDDEVTQQLMELLYQKMLATNDKRKAFNEAQKEIKTKFKHPFYWGAFNMIGLN